MVSRINKQKHWLHCIWVLCLVWVGPLFAQTITLNLKDADINALIGTVAEVTGKNFIVDPRVKGKVTVISSRAMNSDEVYQVFLSILKVHGFAAVPSGPVIKILPDVSAKQDAIPSVDDDAPGRGDEMVTRVVQVDNVAAAQLVPILRPLVPQQGHLAAYPATNVLIMSDRAENVKRLVNIIRRIDKVSDSEIEVIRLEYASAAEVVRILTAISRARPAQGKGGAAQTQALVADERTNSVLLGGDRSDRLRLRAIISHLDTPLERGGNTKVIYLKYATAADLVEVLRGVGKTQGKDVKKGAAAAARNIDKQLDIQADESTNALVITAPPALMRSLEAVIRQLDIRRAQVLVDAIIAEIAEGRARELGIQWAVFDLSGSTTPIGGTNFTNTGTSITDIGQGIIDGQLVGLTPGMSFGLGKIGGGGVNFAAVVNALAGDSDVNILSTPSLVTLDNEEAEIIVGQNVPFLTGSFSNTGAATGSVNPFQTVQRQDVGITLKVKPQINEGNSIVMEITQEVSSISNDAQAVDLITNKRNIKTNVIVDDNHIVVLGGLIEDRVRESEQKVPLLGDIPFLGALFRSKSVNRDKVNLMVFLHPVILRDNKTADRYSGAKYNYIRAMQLEKDNEGVPLMSGKGAPHMQLAEELLELPPLFEAPHTHEASPAGKATGVDEQ
ncbi:MAG: type II secretion system secretin GspD [Gammaproteobacteria bacterium]|nr:MAG: type II secretion system secretin GspD [Gammaproteobacteria bacterium]